MSDLIIMGGHGNGMVVASTIERIGSHVIVGFLNDDLKKGAVVSYPYEVLGTIDEAASLNVYDDLYFYYGIFSLDRKWHNVERIKKIGIPIHKYMTIIDPSAVISPFSEIGYGCFIGPHVTIGPNTRIGNFVQIFGHGFIGHDSVLEDYVFVANNASIGGAITVKEGAWIGANSAVRENVTIGEWAVVGMSSSALEDVPDKTTVVGVPARQIKGPEER